MSKFSFRKLHFPAPVESSFFADSVVCVQHKDAFVFNAGGSGHSSDTAANDNKVVNFHNSKKFPTAFAVRKYA